MDSEGVKALDFLFAKLQEAKQLENACKDDRIAIEEDIVALVADAPDVGSCTLKCSLGRVAIKFGLSYKADVAAIREIDLEGRLPLKLTPAKYEFDASAYEALRKSDPMAFATVAKHVTIKSAKPGVTLKL